MKRYIFTAIKILLVWLIGYAMFCCIVCMIWHEWSFLSLRNILLWTAIDVFITYLCWDNFKPKA